MNIGLADFTLGWYTCEMLKELIAKFDTGNGITDEELNDLLKLRDITVSVEGRRMMVGELASYVSQLQRIAHSRWGPKWTAVDSVEQEAKSKSLLNDR